MVNEYHRGPGRPRKNPIEVAPVQETPVTETVEPEVSFMAEEIQPEESAFDEDLGPLSSGYAGEMRSVSVPTANASGSAPLVSDMEIPGITIDRSKVVVLASKLGRTPELLPMIDPNNKDEVKKYSNPDAFERGQIIPISKIPKIPGMDNVARLKRIGAIGNLDHPDAQPAIHARMFRLQQESRIAGERGIVMGEGQPALAHD